MDFEIIDDAPAGAVIKVIGVGGGGGNALRHMISSGVTGVEFISANTDSQALNDFGSHTVLQMGTNITKGLGAGANPEIGRRAALEDRDLISEVLVGADMVFITAGMGGGTGTGAAPVVAEVAKEMGILTVAVITKPFPFEGKKRMRLAEEGIVELQQHVDSLITIPNEKLLNVLGPQTRLLDAFEAANNVLLGAVQGIADLIIRPGHINVDFADVKTVMSENGKAMMGSGAATGEHRAKEATEAAIGSPLLEDVNLEGARGILINIAAGVDIGLGEFSEVNEIVQEIASENANVIVGTVIDTSLGDELRVTVVATGLGLAEVTEAAPNRVRSLVSAAPKPRVEPQAEPQPAAAKVQQAAGSSFEETTDYSGYEQPAVNRVAVASRASAASAVASEPVQQDIEYMDLANIPAFLRRQAD